MLTCSFPGPKSDPTHKVTIQLLRKDDSTFDANDLDAEARWSYYVASYRKLEPTEGVPIEGYLSMPFLRRNLPEDADEPDERKRPLIPERNGGNLEMRICVNSYRILFNPSSSEYFVHSEKHRTRGHDGSVVDAEQASARRLARFAERKDARNPLVLATPLKEMARLEQRFRAMVDDGVRPTSPVKRSTGEYKAEDDDEEEQSKDLQRMGIRSEEEAPKADEEMVDA